jgi:uncharacterized protein YfbU (UPF0304 family)
MTKYKKKKRSTRSSRRERLLHSRDYGMLQLMPHKNVENYSKNQILVETCPNK